jgi:hypothetical protein
MGKHRRMRKRVNRIWTLLAVLHHLSLISSDAYWELSDELANLKEIAHKSFTAKKDKKEVARKKVVERQLDWLYNP